MKNDIPIGRAMLILVRPKFSVMNPVYLNTPSSSTSSPIARVIHAFLREGFARDIMSVTYQFMMIDAHMINTNTGSPHA